jgi:outer membrane protein assembly factor BamB
MLWIGDDFACDTCLSNDGRLLAGAADGHFEGDRAVSGFLALVDVASSAVLFRVKMKRPNNPHVSDDGTVAVEDWIDWTGPPGSRIVVYGPDGAKRWAKKLRANIAHSGISADGRFVVVSTAGSNCAAHDSKTWLFDARTGEQRWKRDVGSMGVKFDGNRLLVRRRWTTPDAPGDWESLDA